MSPFLVVLVSCCAIITKPLKQYRETEKEIMARRTINTHIFRIDLTNLANAVNAEARFFFNIL